MTVKTKGVAGLCTGGSDPCAAVASGCVAFRVRLATVERVVRDVLANMETSKSEEIDTNVTARVIRSAKARGEAFFFILFFGVRFWVVSAYDNFFYGEASLKFPENVIAEFWETRGADV